MDESAPLRRSSRKSVVSKTEDVTLTPKKKSVTVAEHGTPSRRSTRASSGTPKKPSAEIVSTPKKSLSVLKEIDEETPKKRTALKLNGGGIGTPKRNVNNKLSGNASDTSPSENIVVDSKKINGKAEEIVAEGRPLTRAKRKTLTEKIVNIETEKSSHIKKLKQITKSDLKEAVSCSALVPKADKSGKNYDCTEVEIKDSYKPKSPLKAEEISSANSNKLSENCKSTSKTSFMSKDSKTENNKMSPVGSDDSIQSPKILNCSGSARKYLEFESKSPSKPDEEAAKSPVSATIINTGTPEKLLNSGSEYISMQLETETVISEIPLGYKDNKINGSEKSITETSTVKDNAVSPKCDSNRTETKDNIAPLESAASITKSSVIDHKGSPDKTKKDDVAQLETINICENPSSPEENNKDVNKSEASIKKTSPNKDNSVDPRSPTIGKDVVQLETKNISENLSTSEDDNKGINEGESSIKKTLPNKDSDVDVKKSPTKDDDVAQLESKNENPSSSEDNSKRINKSEGSVTKTSPIKESDVDRKGSPFKTEEVEQSMETTVPLESNNISENPSMAENDIKGINEIESSISKTSPNKDIDVDLNRSPTKDDDVALLESNNISENLSTAEDDNKGMNKSEASVTKTSPNKDKDGDLKRSPTKDDDVAKLEFKNENPSSSENIIQGMNKSEPSVIKTSPNKDKDGDLKRSPTKDDDVAKLESKNENPSSSEDIIQGMNKSEPSVTKTSPNKDKDGDLKRSPTKDDDVAKLESKNENPSSSEDIIQGMNKSEPSVTKTSPNKDKDVDVKRSPTKDDDVAKLESKNENPSSSEDNIQGMNKSEASVTKTSPNKDKDGDLKRNPTKDDDVAKLESKNENPSSSEDNIQGMNKSEASVTKTSPNKNKDVDCKRSPLKTEEIEQSIETTVPLEFKNISETASTAEDDNKGANEFESASSPNKDSDVGPKRSPAKDEDVAQLKPKNETASSSEDNKKAINKSKGSVTKTSPIKESDVDRKGSPFKTEEAEQSMETTVSLETKNISENPSMAEDADKGINEIESSISKTSPNKDIDVDLKRSPTKHDVAKLESKNENPSSSEDNMQGMNKCEALVTKTSPIKESDVDHKGSPFKTEEVEQSMETTVSLETKNISENPSMAEDGNKGINEIESSISKTSPNKDIDVDLKRSPTKDDVAKLESKNENPSSSEDNIQGMNKCDALVTKTSPNIDKDVDHKGSTIKTEAMDASSFRKRKIVEDCKELKTENICENSCINNDKDNPKINNESDLSIVKTCFENCKNNKDVNLIESQIKPENMPSPNKRMRLGGEMPSLPFNNNECSKKTQTMQKISPSKQRIIDILDNIKLFPDIEGNDSDTSELVIDENYACSPGPKDNLDPNKQGECIKVPSNVVVYSSTEEDDIPMISPAKSDGLSEIFSSQSIALDDQISPIKSPYLDCQNSIKTNESVLASITDDKSPLKQKENSNKSTTVDISMKNNIHHSDEKNIEESRLETVSNGPTVEENLISPPHKATKVFAEADGRNSKNELDEFLMSPKDFLNSDEESVICDDKSADTKVKVQRNVDCESDVIVADKAEIDDSEKCSITESVGSSKQNENSPKTSVTSEDCYVIDESDSLFMRDLIKKKCDGTFPKPSPHDNKSSDLEVEIGNSFDEKSTNNEANSETSPVTLDLENPKTFTATIITDNNNISDKDVINDEGEELSVEDDVSGKDFINFEAEEGEESSVHDDKSDKDFINDEEEESSVLDDISDTDFINDEGEESSVQDDVSGKDFIHFEAKEGEDLFVHDIDSAVGMDASNSSKQKRKMSVVIVSSDSDNEEEGVSSKSFPSKIKKQKVSKSERKSNVKESIALYKGRMNNRIEEKVIREVTKTAVFIVSSIDKDLKSESSKNRSNNKQSDAVSRGFTVTEINPKSDRGTKKHLRKNKKQITSPFEVILVLPSETNSRTIKKALKKNGIDNILSINFVNPKVATLGLSTNESFMKVLNLYGKLMIDDQPVYTLEPSTF